ncbi:hypothetical protein PHSY_001455 [Pseudozyma hubeiensis SY62]|uniref:J domain-containing protein n=1 Tax=Pseudozyma hubeiensis (strain SY62) TaxID=1305764 RepID=R9NYM3_PSEHS|nr:hypothetical protein PHSY_001455 [Pseudozyma hubeiensis SY62]GAC93888.1 hypothetical protein PHSY_001455 [Pseudozyma hubeiensis SY62]
MKADLLQLGSLLTWWWFPSFGSTLLLNLLYSLSILRPPPPTSPHLRNTHVQLSRTIIIISTLIYQLVQSTLSTPPNFYTLLSLPTDVDAEGIRRSFRSLARLYHPDKISSTTDETIFIALRQAHDVLSNPTLRFAYDRFGPSITTWTGTQSTTRDYLHHGLLQLVSFYTINPVLYATVGWINGRNDGISFWRLSTLFSLLAFELCLLISPEPPFWISLLFPGRTIFEVREFSHSLFVNWFFASLQLSTALDVLEYGDAAMIERRRSKAEVKEAQLAAVMIKAQGLERMVGTVEKMTLQSFAGEIRPWRQTTRKGKEEREMSAEEERLFERIDKVLLCRSLVQQHPQLMELSQQKEGPVKGEEPQERVKDESVKVEDLQSESKLEEPKAAADEPIAVKAEPVEESLPDSSTTVKVEVMAKETDEPIPAIQVKSEPVEQTLDINTVDTVDAAASTSTIAAPAPSTPAEAGAHDGKDGIVAEAVASTDIESSMLLDTTTRNDAQALQTMHVDTTTRSHSSAPAEVRGPLTSAEAIEPPSQSVSDIAKTTPNQNSASSGVATAEPYSTAAIIHPSHHQP